MRDSNIGRPKKSLYEYSTLLIMEATASSQTASAADERGRKMVTMNQATYMVLNNFESLHTAGFRIRR